MKYDKKSKIAGTNCTRPNSQIFDRTLLRYTLSRNVLTQKTLVKRLETWPDIVSRKILEFPQCAVSRAYEAASTKCNSVYRYERQERASSILNWERCSTYTNRLPNCLLTAPLLIINFVRLLRFPGTDFPGQLSMKKRVSSGLLGRLLEDSWFRGIDNEEAMNSVTGQQTADPTNATIAFRPSLFVVRYPGTRFPSLPFSPRGISPLSVLEEEKVRAHASHATVS